MCCYRNAITFFSSNWHMASFITIDWQTIKKNIHIHTIVIYNIHYTLATTQTRWGKKTRIEYRSFFVPSVIADKAEKKNDIRKKQLPFFTPNHTPSARRIKNCLSLAQIAYRNDKSFLMPPFRPIIIISRYVKLCAIHNSLFIFVIGMEMCSTVAAAHLQSPSVHVKP